MVYFVFAVQSLRSECESFKMKFAEAELQTSAAESAKQTAEQHLAIAQADLESSNSKIAHMEAAFESSTSKIAQLEAILASRDEEAAELTSVRGENSALEEKLRTATAKLAETVDDVERLNQECSQLRESETNRSSSADKMLRELRDELDAKCQQLSVVEDEKQSIASRLEQVQQQLIDSANKYSGLVETHVTLQSDFDHVKEAFDELKRNNLCSNDHTAAVVEECAVLRTTVENLAVQRNAALAEKQAACEEMDGLRKSLSDSMEKCEKLQARENILSSGVAELNHSVLASLVDDTSLSSLPDSDVQSLLAKMLSEVADLQKNLELQVKQAEDERSIREKVENEKASLMQEGDTMHAFIQSLKEENQQLSLMVGRLESSQAELSERCSTQDSQVAQLQVELEAARVCLNVTEPVETSGDLTCLQKSAEEKNAEIERLHQEIRAYKLDIERLERERKLDATVSHQPLQASVLCPLEMGNSESQNGAFDNNVDVQQHDIGEKYDRSVTSENQLTGTNVELSSENREAGTDELLEMKEKMAEWEAMMSMLQVEKDEMQLELQTLEQQELQIFGTVDEVLQCILGTMKGRDLFPLNSDGDDGSGGELWSKLALLKTVVDELLFEMDEMKEKIHHMTDEIKGLEQRVSVSEVENESLREKAEKKTLQLQSLQESEDTLKKRELELCTEIEQLKRSASSAADDVRDKDALVEKLQVLVSDADRMNAEMELLRAEAASKDQLLNDAKASEEMLQQSLNEAREKLHKSEVHLSSVESEYSAKIADLQAERDQLFARVNDADRINAEMELLRAEVANQNQLLNDAKTSGERLQQSLNEAKKQLHNSQLQLSSAETQHSAKIADLQAERDQLFAHVSELQADSDVIKQQSADVSDDLQRKYNEKCSEANRLHNSVISYCKEIEELKEQMKSEVSEKEDLKSEHTKLVGSLKELELHLDQLRTETNNLSAAKISLEQKLASLKEESEQNVKLSESRISQLEASLSTIQADHKLTCDLKLFAENELSNCAQKLEVTSARLQQADDQCSRQAEELQQVREELERLKEDCRMRDVQKSESCESVESVQKLSSSVNVETSADSSTVQVSICVTDCCRCNMRLIFYYSAFAARLPILESISCLFAYLFIFLMLMRDGHISLVTQVFAFQTPTWQPR